MFIVREPMLQGVRRKTEKLGFGIIIWRSDNGSDRRQTFVTMICKRNGTYQLSIRNLKRDDTRSRKCECPFKLCGYCMEDDTWKFNVISVIHNHALHDRLPGNPIVCHLISQERELVSDMTLNMVAPKNILAYLKQKRPLNVSNIKQIYNVHARNNKAVRGKIWDATSVKAFGRRWLCFKLQSFWKVIVRDISWSHPNSVKLFNTFSFVLIIDSIYKTNKYRLPLLEIIVLLLRSWHIQPIFHF